MAPTYTPPFSHPVTVTLLRASNHFQLEPEEAARQKIATAFRLESIPEWRAQVEVELATNGMITLLGRVNARIRPYCVVSLEAFDDVVEAPIDIRFAPASLIEKMEKRAQEDGVLDFEPPDLFEGNELDLGAICVEFFSIALDPYPKKAGAVFLSPLKEEQEEHPFAALKKLQKPEI